LKADISGKKVEVTRRGGSLGTGSGDTGGSGNRGLNSYGQAIGAAVKIKDTYRPRPEFIKYTGASMKPIAFS